MGRPGVPGGRGRWRWRPARPGGRLRGGRSRPGADHPLLDGGGGAVDRSRRRRGSALRPAPPRSRRRAHRLAGVPRGRDAVVARRPGHHGGGRGRGRRRRRNEAVRSQRRRRGRPRGRGPRSRGDRRRRRSARRRAHRCTGRAPVPAHDVRPRCPARGLVRGRGGTGGPSARAGVLGCVVGRGTRAPRRHRPAMRGDGRRCPGRAGPDRSVHRRSGSVRPPDRQLPGRAAPRRRPFDPHRCRRLGGVAGRVALLSGQRRGRGRRVVWRPRWRSPRWPRAMPMSRPR